MRSGTPATNIMARLMARKTRAEPRSGSFKIKINGSKVNPSAAKNTRGRRNSSAGRLKIIGQQQDEGDLGKFRGLQTKKPSVIQRLPH